MKVKTLKWETTVNLGIFQSSLSTALSAPKMLYRIAPRWDEENNRKTLLRAEVRGEKVDSTLRWPYTAQNDYTSL